jgi:hypothetical protein
MTINWEQVGPYVILPVMSLLGAWLVANIQHKGRPENALIDQLQEEMGKMRKRMDRFEARDRVYIPHIILLNAHIEQGLGPPAPRIPKVIQELLDEKGED